MHEEREHQRNCFRSTSVMELRCTCFLDLITPKQTTKTLKINNIYDSIDANAKMSSQNMLHAVADIKPKICHFEMLQSKCLQTNFRTDWSPFLIRILECEDISLLSHTFHCCRARKNECRGKFYTIICSPVGEDRKLRRNTR